MIKWILKGTTLQTPIIEFTLHYFELHSDHIALFSVGMSNRARSDMGSDPTDPVKDRIL